MVEHNAKVSHTFSTTIITPSRYLTTRFQIALNSDGKFANALRCLLLKFYKLYLRTVDNTASIVTVFCVQSCTERVYNLITLLLPHRASYCWEAAYFVTVGNIPEALSGQM